MVALATVSVKYKQFQLRSLFCKYPSSSLELLGLVGILCDQKIHREATSFGSSGDLRRDLICIRLILQIGTVEVVW